MIIFGQINSYVFYQESTWQMNPVDRPNFFWSGFQNMFQNTQRTKKRSDSPLLHNCSSTSSRCRCILLCWSTVCWTICIHDTPFLSPWPALNKLWVSCPRSDCLSRRCSRSVFKVKFYTFCVDVYWLFYYNVYCCVVPLPFRQFPSPFLSPLPSWWITVYLENKF